MSDRHLTRTIKDATKSLEGRLASGETVIAAIEGQRVAPGKVWLWSMGIGLFLSLLLPIGGIIAYIFVLLIVAVISYGLGYLAGTRLPTNERLGFGFTLALTERGVYLFSQPLFGAPTTVEGPYATSEIEAYVERKSFSSVVTFSGAFDLSLRVAAGAAPDRFVELLDIY